MGQSNKRLLASQFPLIGEPHKRFQRYDMHQIRMNEVFCQQAGRVIVSERPPIAAKNQVGSLRYPAPDSIRKAHDLERHLLFGRPASLLPFERNKNGMATLTRNRVRFVRPASASRPNIDLSFVFVSPRSSAGRIIASRTPPVVVFRGVIGFGSLGFLGLASGHLCN